MGMNGVQVQARVVLPLALPVIVAGIRITAVTTIGIATLGPLVTVDNLGSLIISDGVYLAQFQRLVAGSILVSALAIGVDLALLALERGLARGRPAISR
jgi:osmoprotectant transport system permease protein